VSRIHEIAQMAALRSARLALGGTGAVLADRVEREQLVNERKRGGMSLIGRPGNRASRMKPKEVDRRITLDSDPT